MQSWWTRLRGDIYQRLAGKRLAWKDIVALFDPTGTGAVTVPQLQQGLAEGLGLTIEPTEAEDAFTLLCPAGRLTVAALLEGIVAEGRGQPQPPEVEEALQALEQYRRARRRGPVEMFRVLDEDDRGALTPAEVQRLLRWLAEAPTGRPHATVDELLPLMMKSLSDDGDQPITLVEFLRNSPLVALPQRPPLCSGPNISHAHIQRADTIILNTENSIRPVFFPRKSSPTGFLHLFHVAQTTSQHLVFGLSYGSPPAQPHPCLHSGDVLPLGPHRPRPPSLPPASPWPR
eukprot:EG_transcript_22563